MEELIIKQVKTSCPFPLMIYKTDITYNEVRKASGIAYILLELIQKSGNSQDKLSDILLKFGIPADLHYIFGQEISGLLNTEILSCPYSISAFSNPKYFNEMRINDISLTAKGQKMFKEGAIPTGAEKVKSKDIFYSPVTRKFDVQSTQTYSPLASSYLGEEFIEKVDIDISGMEDYLNANLTKVGLKAEERIIRHEISDAQSMQVRKEEGMTIIIRPSGVEFAFDTSDETAFFYKYYSSALMTEGLLMKNKYKFVNFANELVQVPTVSLESLQNVSSVYIPDDIRKQANRPCKIFANRGSLGIERTDKVILLDKANSIGLLEDMDEHSEFALIDVAGIKYYCPVNVVMPCKRFDDSFEMQLLVENVLPDSKFKELIARIFESYKSKPFDAESASIIMFVVKVFGSSDYYKKYVEAQLNDLLTTDDKIGRLMMLHYAFSKDSAWLSVFEQYSKTLFSESVDEVHLDNMIYKNTVLAPLVKEMRIPDIDYVQAFSKAVISTESPELVYQALETAGFELKNILRVVNVVKQYIDSVLDNQKLLSDTELSGLFRPLQFNLWKLNDMLGVENDFDYTIRDDYNVDTFFNTYSTLLSTYKAVEKYGEYAPEEYAHLKRYFSIFEKIHDLLSIERTASSHPDNITKKYIDDLINRGKYKEAICDLVVKMQYDLRIVLNADSMVAANDLLNKAGEQKIVDKNALHELHSIRMCRNSFQHPERKQITFTKQELEHWRDLVFDIKGGNK